MTDVRVKFDTQGTIAELAKGLPPGYRLPKSPNFSELYNWFDDELRRVCTEDLGMLFALCRSNWRADRVRKEFLRREKTGDSGPKRHPDDPG